MSEQAMKKVEARDHIERVIEAWILKRQGNEHRKCGPIVTFMADGTDLAEWCRDFGEWGPVDAIHDLGALREHLGLSPWSAPVEEDQPGTSTTPTEALKQEKSDLAAHVERLEVDLHRTRTLLDLSNEVRRALMEAMHRKEEALRLKREYKQARRAAKRAQEALALAQDGMVKAVYSDGSPSRTRGEAMVRLEAPPPRSFAIQLARAHARDMAAVANTLAPRMGSESVLRVEASGGWFNLFGAFLGAPGPLCWACGQDARSIHLAFTAEGSTEDAVTLLSAVTVPHRCLQHTPASMLALLDEERG